MNPQQKKTPVPVPVGLTGQDLYVEADVDDPKPFVVEQIIYRAKSGYALLFPATYRVGYPPGRSSNFSLKTDHPADLAQHSPRALLALMLGRNQQVHVSKVEGKADKPH
jgi:hypothetical protein